MNKSLINLNKAHGLKKQPIFVNLGTKLLRMRIVLDRVDDAFHFEAKNEEGNIVHIDGSPSIGGAGEGARPMQLLVMGLGGCSAMDIVLILKKQRQVIDDLKIILEAERHDDRIPATFKSIQITYEFKGELDHKKVKRAVSLGIDKYCSVTKILEDSCEITFESVINGEPVKK